MHHKHCPKNTHQRKRNSKGATKFGRTTESERVSRNNCNDSPSFNFPFENVCFILLSSHGTAARHLVWELRTLISCWKHGVINGPALEVTCRF